MRESGKENVICVQNKKDKNSATKIVNRDNIVKPESFCDVI